jgi:hypothetical protein
VRPVVNPDALGVDGIQIIELSAHAKVEKRFQELAERF